MNSNRLAHKTSKDKQRPKSTERTKSLKGKPSENATEEITNDDINASPNWNETINQELDEFKINPILLQSNHSPQPPKDRPKDSIVIRRAVPNSKYKTSKPKEKVIIAKPVQSEEQIDVSTLVQTKPAEPDDVKPYDILGTVKEFKQQAANERQIQLLSAKNSFTPNINYVEAEENKMNTDAKHLDESNALKNWEIQMKKRRKQQEYLARKMNSSNDMLIMNQSDSYRSIQEERTLIDRAMPFKDYGKGYRVGSEFWKQVEGIGGEDGISITLGKTEKGNVAPIEHIGCPGSVKTEMGTNWLKTDRMEKVHYAWWKSSYLDERKNYLKDVINELDPHTPYVDGLEVIGQGLQINQKNPEKLMEIANSLKDIESTTEEELDVDGYDKDHRNDPLSEFQDVYAPPIFGPSLLINGHTASWEGSYDHESDEEVGLNIRLSFEATVGELGNSFIDMTNDGTTVLHYSWKKLPKYDPFGLKKGRLIERFYFDIRNGIILPGETVNIPFIFKSPNVGIFTEEWCLQTHPVLCGGKKISMSLHGIATQNDELENKRVILEKQYLVRQNEQMASRLVNEILRGIKTPPRPSSPLQPLTEEEEFKEKNKDLNYSTLATVNLKNFFSELNPDEDWDLSLLTLMKNAENISDETIKEDALQRLNKEIVNLYEARRNPAERINYDQCYQIICEYIDKFVVKSMTVRQSLGLPEKELIIKQDNPQQNKRGKKVVETQKAARVETKSPNKKEGTPVKNKTPNPKDKLKAEAVPVAPKEEVPIENDSKNFILPDDTQNVNYGKYLEKMYSQMYSCLRDLAEDMDGLLSMRKT